MSVEVFGWEWLSAYREPLLRAAQVVLIVLLAWLLQGLLARGLGRLIVGSACKPGARGRVLGIELFTPPSRWCCAGNLDASCQ